MKQKDIVLIVAVAGVAAIVSLVITQALFVPKKAKLLTAEKVDRIDSQFNTPDSNVFNSNAINPTQLIKIGDSNNSNPF